MVRRPYQIKSFRSAPALSWILSSLIKDPLLRKQQQRQYKNAVIMITMLTMRNQVMTTIPNSAMNRFFFFWRYSPQEVRSSSFTRFLDRTKQHTTVGRTPLDEWSASRKDFHLTTHTRDIHDTCWIRTDNFNREAAADLRLRPLNHWDR